MRSRHPLTIWVVGAIAISAILVVVSYAIDWFPTAASTSAGEVDTLYHVLTVVSIAVFMLVMTVALYSVWRFRARPGDLSDGAPIHGNTRLEVIWVAIPFIMVTALAGYGAKVLADEEASHPNEIAIRVIGQQFAWHFQYENRGNFQSDFLYLPKDQPVKFDIVSRDVIHEFWVPSWRIGEDAVPGTTTHLRATPNRIGTYDIVCAELCGQGHATMRSTVHIVSRADFQTWLSKQKPGSTVGGTSVSSTTAPARRLLADVTGAGR